MSRWTAFLIDLDGTLYHGTRMIPGADKLIHSMKRLNIPYLFVTNNSSRTPEDVATHLRNMGIPAEASDVCTSAMASADYISKVKPGAKVAPIGEYGLIEALNMAGLIVTEEQPDYVVQGIDRQFSYEKLTKAARWIRSGAKSIMTNPDILLPTTDGLIPGAGTIGASIQAASGVAPVVIGKPSEIIMKYAMERLKVEPQHTAVIGDNMYTDIAAGAHAGCRTILVLTGVTQRDNLQDLVKETAVKPDYICEDLDEVRTMIEPLCS